MEQKKTGLFLKELRKEKNLTQEQLAEIFNISSRSVSRWETGTNLPDLSLLIELADFYEVDIREIIDGERKNTMMKETKETLTKVAEYAEQDKQRTQKRLAVVCALSVMLLATGCFWEVEKLPYLQDFSIGVAMGIQFIMILFLTGKLDKAQSRKRRKSLLPIQ